MYCERHKGEYPRKVSYTLWSSEFIETEGATIAQILYMLGVEPVRDAFGRVTDLRLIPSKQLGLSLIHISQLFVKQYFADATYSRVEKEKDNGSWEYEVCLLYTSK